MEQYKLHKLRAKHFYGLLSKNEDEVLTVSFDMQQNQPLPMLKISETFYARQIWLYNITFVVKEIDEEKIKFDKTLETHSYIHGLKANLQEVQMRLYQLCITSCRF